MSRLPRPGRPVQLAMLRAGDLRHRHRRVGAALGLAFALWPASPFAQSPDGAAIARLGNASGAPPCTPCHGADGEGQVTDAGTFPRLAGLSPAYFIKQIEDYRRERRNDAMMQPVAAALSAEETSTLADYYAAQPAAALPARSAAPDIIAQGERLNRIGKWQAGVPPCLSCHGPDGAGVAPSFPYLAGQPAAYIEAQLRRWKSGERRNDPLGLMQTVVRGLDEPEIAAAAAYFQTLGPPRQQGAP